MKILHCIPSMEGGGAERQLAYLAGELARSGCDIHVALTREGPYFDRLRATGATIHQCGPCGTHDPRLFTRLAATIAKVKPDIVQCWLLQMEILGGLAALVTGTPWLFSERSSAQAYPPTLKNGLRVRMAALANGIVANSVAGNQYWEARVRKTVPRYVVTNGLPLEQIAAAPVADMGVSPGDATILYAGRFDEGKNAVALVEALHRVRTAMPVRALLYGDGPTRDDVERLVVRLGLTDRVRVRTFVPDLWSLLKGATMLVSLSRFEGSPNVVLEAMACGCPLVVADIAAHHELLDDQTAMFVDPDDREAVARTIENVLADPVAARRRADAAKERAQQHALPVIAAQYLRVYEDVLSRSTRTQKRMAS